MDWSVSSTKCLLTPSPQAPVIVMRRGCRLRRSLEARFSVMREEDAPVSKATLMVLFRSSWMAFVMAVCKKDTCGGAFGSAEEAG